MTDGRALPVAGDAKSAEARLGAGRRQAGVLRVLASDWIEQEETNVENREQRNDT
nr:hypothetical protein [uncultured Roseibium sp.]